MATWKREQIESRLRVFPEGQVAGGIDGRVAASGRGPIADGDYASDWDDRRRVSDGGRIRNHHPRGDTLHGIEIVVRPGLRGLNLARRIDEARKQLCKDKNLRTIVIGGRIPGYGEHADTTRAGESVDRVRRKVLFDPVPTTRLANGIPLKALIPNYWRESEVRGRMHSGCHGSSGASPVTRAAGRRPF